jgi:hypothetical protein
MHTYEQKAPRRLPARLTGAAALALMVAVGWLAIPTSASATTTNDIWTNLLFPASAHSNLERCKTPTRKIVTGPGRYHWRVFSAQGAHTNQTQWEQRTLHLRRARYEWSVCWYDKGRRWGVYTQLYNLSHGGYARLPGDDIKGSFGNGTYHIGSTLDNVRSGR